MIRILITGKGSYIGTHFMNYLKENYKISLRDFNELYWSKVFDKYNDIEYKKIGKSNSTLLVRINLSS